MTLSTIRGGFPLHPFHLTAVSPWPFYMSMVVLSFLSSLVHWFNGLSVSDPIMLFSLVVLVASFAKWYTDITVEADYLGLHSREVTGAHTMGVVLFVVTELFFFVSIFWAFFHSSLSPTVDLGISWPPAGIPAMDPFTLPLMNTVLLLSSGAFVTYAHHALLSGHRSYALTGMLYTLLLAAVFLSVQGYEYTNAAFTIADGVFGSVFFFTTGFHCFHVIIGLSALAVMTYLLGIYQSTRTHHAGLESAILYWHFVDAVWIFVFLGIYLWGGDTLVDPSLAEGSQHAIPFALI